MNLTAFPLIIICCLNFASCLGQRVITDDQAIKELRHFYIYYIKEVSQVGKEHDRKIDSLLRRYSTASLTTQLKEQDEAGYDFFVNSNGPQIESANTVKVLKDNKEKDTYIVSFVYFRQPHSEDEIVKIKLRLIKGPSSILIDQIIR